ncbi:cucumber peeling cupredoxin-like [Senna tora]|uniref:Cucumber peeling cupredoxin-like n=1 Tax=Senna tora TaxID=362788 RepID=A0A834T260_9FABA|nr:cucumber peeling cupredoxin-like [Senna tora]
MGVSVNGMVAILLGMQVLLLQYCATAQTVHVVGDSIGWTVPENSDAYDNWANQNNFAVEAHTVHIVGDSIGWTVPQNTDEYENWADKNMFAVVFNFTTNAHDVVEVPEGSYDSCTSNNNITEIFTTGPTNITLSSVGKTNKQAHATIGTKRKTDFPR